MPDETQPASTTPATVAPEQGSAPENKQQRDNVGGMVDPAKKQLDEGAAVRGIKGQLFELREKSRKKDSEMESLRAENAALKANKAESSRQENVETKTSAFDDPEGWSSKVEERAAKRAEEKARELYAQGEAERVWKDSAGKTATWLLSRSHLKQDPNAKNEIYAFVDQATLEKNPKAAVRDAYLDWCESKGIAPDLEHKVPDYSSAHNGTGVRPSATGSGNGSGEVTLDQLRAMSEPERRRAISEGRYKGKTIRI